MSQTYNDDFKFSIQIPNFFSPEKCDELLKDIMESEQDVIGCVGDENGTAILPEIEKLMSGIFLTNHTMNLDQTKPIKIGSGYKTKCFKS